MDCSCEWCKRDNIHKLTRHSNECSCAESHTKTVGLVTNGRDVPDNSTFFQSSSVVNTATAGKVMSINCTDEKSGANKHKQQANIINPTPSEDMQHISTVSEYDDTSLAINASSCYHNSDTSYNSNDYSSEIEAWAIGVEEHFSSYEDTADAFVLGGLTESSTLHCSPSQSVLYLENSYSDTSVQSINLSGSLPDGINSSVSSGHRLIIEGATLNDSSSKVNNSVEATTNHGLHSQWGVTFTQNLVISKRQDCQIIEHSDMAEWMQQAHKEVAKHNKPNYLGARVQVVSQLNIPLWKSLLADYKYSRVVDYLQFGFPVGLDYENFNFKQQVDNHASANKFPEAVDAYITTELKHRALVGPLQSNPFAQMHTSPMMTRPKPDSTRRLIVDLSWPLGDSVNSRIADNHFDGNTCSLKYPTIDQIVQQILTIGDQPLLFKVDLKRAYRNLRTDPRDFPVLGLSWRGAHYVDVSVPFGLKTGASACQLVTDSVTHFLATA